jgi:hypothetical protein
MLLDIQQFRDGHVGFLAIAILDDCIRLLTR